MYNLVNMIYWFASDNENENMKWSPTRYDTWHETLGPEGQFWQKWVSYIKLKVLVGSVQRQWHTAEHIIEDKKKWKITCFKF